MSRVKAPDSGRAAQDAPAWDEGGWRSRAACRGEDPELFFPVGSSEPAALAQIAGAKAICARCPVREACLRFALYTGQDYGIWGGLTEDERRRLQRRERAAALRQAAGPTRERRHELAGSLRRASSGIHQMTPVTRLPAGHPGEPLTVSRAAPALRGKCFRTLRDDFYKSFCLND